MTASSYIDRIKRKKKKRTQTSQGWIFTTGDRFAFQSNGTSISDIYKQDVIALVTSAYPFRFSKLYNI